MCGTSFGKSTVSRLVGELDTDLTAWRERRLDDVTYPYLVVDARYEHVRVDGRVVSQGVLVVKGVRDDGHREILAVDVADSESEATADQRSDDELFKGLKDRGLKGVRLVTSDDHRGLVAAIARHFQGASWQRCQVHFLRNALGKVARKHRKALAGDVKAVFAAPAKDWALDSARGVVERWAPLIRPWPGGSRTRAKSAASRPRWRASRSPSRTAIASAPPTASSASTRNSSVGRGW